jgi:hypothetical protein
MIPTRWSGAAASSVRSFYHKANMDGYLLSAPLGERSGTVACTSPLTLRACLGVPLTLTTPHLRPRASVHAHAGFTAGCASISRLQESDGAALTRLVCDYTVPARVSIDC